MQIEHLGGGTVRFIGVVDVPQDSVIAYLEEQKKKWKQENFSIVTDEDGRPIHAINKGGFIYKISEIDESPVRIQALDHEFFRDCDSTIYRCLLEYIHMFPAILQLLWWRTAGHVLCYEKGAKLGFHSDNDVNYRFGAEPKEQHATRNVLSALVYLNDSTEDETIRYSFSGGSMEIPYFGIDIKPKRGDVVMMPANYLGAHQINEVTRGSRYSFLCWFGQGSADIERGIFPILSESGYENRGQWWLDKLIPDFNDFINEKYSSSEIPEKLLMFKNRKDDHL